MEELGRILLAWAYDAELGRYQVAAAALREPTLQHHLPAGTVGAVELRQRVGKSPGLPCWI
jgi:hypothetical protein